AVFGALLLQDVAADAVADAPVEQHQRRVDGPGRGVAGVLDQGADVRHQLRRRGRGVYPRLGSGQPPAGLLSLRHAASLLLGGTVPAAGEGVNLDANALAMNT